jgi:hypothetical protein
MKIILLQGRLGNQLFIIAFAKYMMQEWGCKVKVICEREDKIHPITLELAKDSSIGVNLQVSQFYSKVFLALNILSSKMPIIFKYMAFICRYFYEDQSKPLLKSQLMRKRLVSGFFQRAWIVSAIKDEFGTPLWKLLQKHSSKVPDIENCTGIHLRRGDYRNLNNERSLGCLSWDYYSQEIEKNDQFVCFTDAQLFEIPKQIVENARSIYSSNDMNDINTLYNLGMCRRLIIANSTLSWWAGFFAIHNKREVIAPEPWFHFDHQSNTEIYLQDFKKRKAYFEEDI